MLELKDKWEEELKENGGHSSLGTGRWAVMLQSSGVAGTHHSSGFTLFILEGLKEKVHLPELLSC